MIPMFILQMDGRMVLMCTIEMGSPYMYVYNLLHSLSVCSMLKPADMLNTHVVKSLYM